MYVPRKPRGEAIPMPEQQTDDATTEDLSAALIDRDTRQFDFLNARERGVSWRVAIDRTDEEINNGRWEPMVNTLWPLPDEFEVPDDVRDRLDNMTVVEIEGHDETATALALTGGGMDMSWHIARTYVNLGYLPPATLGKLPEMAGMDYDAPENERAIRALNKSHRHMIDRHSRHTKDLARLGK